jgi:RNA polymerase sigma factor, sigma-70 family
MTEYSDGQIVELFKKGGGRESAFTLLVQKYQERLYWHIRRMVADHDDADDVLQNTFLKVWSGLDGFREDSQLYTWLYRIATNEALTFLKKKRSSLFLSIENLDYQLGNSLESDTYFDGDAIQLKLQKSILRLPDKQRLVFNMKYYENMKYEEMSTVLHTSVGALKASFHHAVKKIEKFMAED